MSGGQSPNMMHHPVEGVRAQELFLLLLRIRKGGRGGLLLLLLLRLLCRGRGGGGRRRRLSLLGGREVGPEAETVEGKAHLVYAR